MTQRLTPESAKSPSSAWDQIRGRIAVAMIGLMGGTAVPAALQGCKASFNLNTVEGVRNATVDKDGAKTIVVGDAYAVLMLGRSQDEVGRLEALLHVSGASPLLESSDKIRTYALPKDADPWTQLVAEPNRRITLRSEGNHLALIFDCFYEQKKPPISCHGDEIDPVKLEARIAAEKEKGNQQPSNSQAGAPQPATDGGTATKPATDGGTEAGTQQPGATGSLADTSYSVATDIKAKLDQLKPAISTLKWDEKQQLARDLASVKPEWKEYVEKQIREINASTMGNLAQLNLDSTILHLLALRPDQIENVATILGVTLQGPKDAGADASADAGADGGQSVQTAEVDLVAFLKLVNQERARRGAPPVQYHDCPGQMAEYWAKKPEAAANGHEANGDTPVTRAQQFGCKNPTMENVSWPNSFDATALFEQWKASQAHLVNMVRPNIKKIGLSCVSGTGQKTGNFCVMTGTGD